MITFFLFLLLQDCYFWLFMFIHISTVQYLSTYHIWYIEVLTIYGVMRYLLIWCIEVLTIYGVMTYLLIWCIEVLTIYVVMFTRLDTLKGSLLKELSSLKEDILSRQEKLDSLEPSLNTLLKVLHMQEKYNYSVELYCVIF